MYLNFFFKEKSAIIRHDVLYCKGTKFVNKFQTKTQHFHYSYWWVLGIICISVYSCLSGTNINWAPPRSVSPVHFTRDSSSPPASTPPPPSPLFFFGFNSLSGGCHIMAHYSAISLPLLKSPPTHTSVKGQIAMTIKQTLKNTFQKRESDSHFSFIYIRKHFIKVSFYYQVLFSKHYFSLFNYLHITLYEPSGCFF